MAVPAKISTAAATQVTVSTTAINLGTQFAAEGVPFRSSEAITLILESSGGGARLFWDGNTPTSALGMPVEPGSSLTIVGSTLKDINIIRRDASDAVVNVQSGNSYSSRN